MLNFRNTNIFFLALLFVLVLLRVPFYFYLFSIIIYSLIVFWGCIKISAGFFIPIVCQAKTKKKEIAISFDDGPAIQHTASILAILKNENIQATFFCIGNRIAGNENILQQIHSDGHTIGNHSYSHHFWFDMYSSKKMLADMQQMDTEVQRAIGVKPKLFRPPYGVTNPNVKKAIIKGGYIAVGWSVRSMDTVAKDEKIFLQKICAGIKPGAVFLFHDTCKITLDVLPVFIKEVKKMGYHIVPLDKMLALTAYE